jgi:uncharacterized repeat protein (TIGR03803 family)
MRKGIPNPLPFLVLVIALNSVMTGQVPAQVFKTLYSFSDYNDGGTPQAGLVLSTSTLYGTASGGGGSANGGTVFRINTDGTGFTNLHSFAGSPGDGSFPLAALVLSSNSLYGTTYFGGGANNGTVFKLNIDRTGFTILYSFTNNDGANPASPLALSGTTLHGTTELGGTSDNGTVFALSTDGTHFATLHSFTTATSPALTNSDGIEPFAGLLLSENTLYGTAYLGGSFGNGSVFKVNMGGTGFTPVYSLQGSDGLARNLRSWRWGTHYMERPVMVAAFSRAVL